MGVTVGRPVAASIRKAVLSSPAEATREPSGLTVTAYTLLACRGGVAQRGLPLSASQAWTTPSAPAVSSHLLSGPNIAAVTGPLWRSGGVTGSWSAARRTRA